MGIATPSRFQVTPSVELACRIRTRPPPNPVYHMWYSVPFLRTKGWRPPPAASAAGGPRSKPTPSRTHHEEVAANSTSPAVVTEVFVAVPARKSVSEVWTQVSPRAGGGKGTAETTKTIETRPASNP